MNIPLQLRRKLLPVFLGGCVCLGATPGTATGETDWIGPANNAFALDLYGKLASGNQDNLFFSPSSIETALAMTYAGARGDTATQMATTLRLPAGSGTINKDFGEFLNGLNGTEAGGKRGYELSIANALWGQDGYAFLPGFLEVLKSDYGAGLDHVDFKTDSDGARKTINAWVEKETQDKITDLIPPGALTAATRLVLTNAIYFKGTWESPFEKAATQDQPFHLSGGADKNAAMMHRTGTYGYMEDEGFQALKLPYAGNELAMIILLPLHPDGLPELEKEMTPKKLTDAFGVFRDEEVQVTIPKFTMTEQFELAPTLESMGMKAAFEDADFSGMTGNRAFAISAVIHKAYVEVTEEGTVAAAATGVAMTMMAIPEAPPPVFQADHPFIFVIQDEKSGAFLFMGRVAEPQ